MIAEVIVRPLAETDVREAAFWYESKREGLGAEFTLELDALYELIATPVGGEPSRLRRHRLENCVQAYRRVHGLAWCRVGRSRDEWRYADQPSMTYADGALSKKVLQSSEFDAFAPRTRGVLR